MRWYAANKIRRQQNTGMQTKVSALLAPICLKQTWRQQSCLEHMMHDEEVCGNMTLWLLCIWGQIFSTLSVFLLFHYIRQMYMDSMVVKRKSWYAVNVPFIYVSEHGICLDILWQMSWSETLLWGFNINGIKSQVWQLNWHMKIFW